MNRTSRRSKLLLITGFLTAGAVALAGCSSTRASSSASTKPSKVTLVVYSAQGYDHAMTAAFTKATGIPVKLDDNSTGRRPRHGRPADGTGPRAAHPARRVIVLPGQGLASEP